MFRAIQQYENVYGTDDLHVANPEFAYRGIPSTSDIVASPIMPMFRAHPAVLIRSVSEVILYTPLYESY